MSYPVQGSIIREYAKGRNDGIDIGASVGTTVTAAASGQVAAITATRTANQYSRDPPSPGSTAPATADQSHTHVDNIPAAERDAVSRGQQSIAKVADFDPARVHFEVRKGFDSVDPMGYLR